MHSHRVGGKGHLRPDFPLGPPDVASVLRLADALVPRFGGGRLPLPTGFAGLGVSRRPI